MNSDINSLDSRVKPFISDDIDFSALSRGKLKEVLSLEDIREIIVLPDIHSKPDNPFPTGIVTLTSNTIYPFAIGQEIGCGMRVLKTSLYKHDIDASTTDTIFNAIKKSLRDGIKDKPLLSRGEYVTTLQRGITEKDILHAIPKDAFLGGYYRLGALGGGNHFLEMQFVQDILDSALAAKFDLSKGQIVFIFHTGSGVFSKRLDNYYGIRYEDTRLDKDIRKTFRKILFHFGDFNFLRYSKRWNLFFRKNFKGIPADSAEGKRYITAFQAAMNYSVANRTLISDFIQQALKNSLKKDFAVRLLSDTSHERIDFEEFEGKKFWVHRNGATKVHNLDEILLIPAFMGGPSFLCLPDSNISLAHYSVNHGVGRIYSKQEAKSKFDTEDIYRALQSKEIRLYKLGNEDMCEQAPGAFKDIHKVMDALKANQLVKPVATTLPLAILKG